ncbi:MAG: Gldg family protein [Oligoflexia bacterium]|nr:Gldg family protein [Oligoflexia bacterium]
MVIHRLRKIDTLPIFRYTIYLVTVILFLCNCVTWIVVPEFFLFNLILILLIFLLVAVIIFIHRVKLNIYAKSSHFKNLSQNTLSAILLFLILALINFLGYRFAKQFYFGSEEKSKLSSQTLKILEENKSALNFKIFVRRNDQTHIRYLFELYRIHGHGLITYEFIDPDLAPTTLQKYDISDYGTIILEATESNTNINTNKRKISIHDISENSLTKGLLRFFKQKNSIIYYTIGHEERDFLVENTDGYSYLKSLIERELIELRPLSLTSTKDVPEDASALIIFGPKLAFFPEEIENLDRYLRGGGSVLLALDPNFKAWKHHDLVALFEEWGILYKNYLAIDLASHIDGSQGTVPLAKVYSEMHPITAKFQGQSFFPVSGIFKIDSRPETIQRLEITPLIFTSDRPYSFAESSLAEILALKPNYNTIEDEGGPLNLAMAMQVRDWGNQEKGDAPPLKTKIVAFACSTFASNAYSNFRANYNIILNALSWLTDDGQSIASDRPELKNRPIFLSSQQLGIIFYFSLIIAPLALILIALYFFRRRKKS